MENTHHNLYSLSYFLNVQPTVQKPQIFINFTWKIT